VQAVVVGMKAQEDEAAATVKPVFKMQGETHDRPFGGTGGGRTHSNLKDQARSRWAVAL
jgi:hypothetical protein